VVLCKKKKALFHEDFEQEYGRHWIWTALDLESKLLISFFVGQLTLEDCNLFIKDLAGRIKTKPLFTSDELPHYQTTLAGQFSSLEESAKTGKPGRPRGARQVVDPELKYATVHKKPREWQGCQSFTKYHFWRPRRSCSNSQGISCE
jgi:hypothetical protein